MCLFDNSGPLLYNFIMIGEKIMNSKKGFISMATVYTFLIVFLLVLASILSKYTARNNLVNGLSRSVKEELNKEYFNE